MPRPGTEAQAPPAGPGASGGQPGEPPGEGPARGGGPTGDAEQARGNGPIGDGGARPGVAHGRYGAAGKGRGRPSIVVGAQPGAVTGAQPGNVAGGHPSACDAGDIGGDVDVPLHCPTPDPESTPRPGEELSDIGLFSTPLGTLVDEAVPEEAVRPGDLLVAVPSVPPVEQLVAGDASERRTGAA